MSKKKIHLNEIDDLVKKMDDRPATIYEVFNRDKVKEKFKETEIFRCFKDQFSKKKKKEPLDISKKHLEKLYNIFYASQIQPRVKEIKEHFKEKGEEVDWYSDNSYQFSEIEYYQQYKFYEKLAKESKAEIRNKIFKTFNIENKDEFKNKFDWACNGESDELKKISILSSSSLCAFLCFHNVSEEKPLKIKILKRWASFTESIFEWENPLFGKPSSIDVVLVGNFIDGKHEKIVYFIESKFSEYLPNMNENDDGSFIISGDYISEKEEIGKRIYSDANFGEGEDKINLNLNLNFHPKKRCFKISPFPNQTKPYIEGVKQMIGHYIGVNNLLNGRKEHNFGKYLELPKNTHIYLGTIIYSINDKEGAAAKYVKLAGRTTEILSRDLSIARKNRLADRRFKQVLYPKTYQHIFTSENEEGKQNLKNLTEEIKTYYNFK